MEEKFQQGIAHTLCNYPQVENITPDALRTAQFSIPILRRKD